MTLPINLVSKASIGVRLQPDCAVSLSRALPTLLWASKGGEIAWILELLHGECVLELAYSFPAGAFNVKVNCLES